MEGCGKPEFQTGRGHLFPGTHIREWNEYHEWVQAKDVEIE
jgi:hypothetical protein